MKVMKFTILVVVFLLPFVSFAAHHVPGKSNGIAYPASWQDWATISISYRTDNNTIRVILGNDVAVKAARSGETNKWPDGAIIGKVVWKAVDLESWKAAKKPSDLVHAEFMFKDSKQYADTYGWGWARWVGLNKEPFNKGAQSCIGCHTPVEDNDWVFTIPAVFPK